jgi:hypothetical protein
VTIESLLLRWFKNAVKWSQIQTDAANDLANALEPELVSEWKEMVEAWLEDHTNPDPYEEKEDGSCSGSCGNVITHRPAQLTRSSS